MKNSRLRQDLPISINDRVILPFREGLHMRSFAKIKPSRKFPNLYNLTDDSCHTDAPMEVLAMTTLWLDGPAEGALNTIINNSITSKQGRRQGSGIDTIKYHT